MPCPRDLSESCGIIPTTKTTIDAAGRVVIPKALRPKAGLQPGVPLDIHLTDGRIEIEPAPSPVKLVREGRFLVAVSEVEGPPLTNERVQETREELWRERGIVP